MALSKDDLLISIAADTKDAVQGVTRIRDELGRFVAQTKDTGDAVDRSFKDIQTQFQAVAKVAQDSQHALGGIHGGVSALGTKMQELAHWAEGAHKSLNGFGAANVVMRAVIENAREGVEALHKAWEKTVGAFQESQDTIRKLATTMALMGAEHMPETVKEFEHFAKKLSETSTVSEETSLHLLQLAAAAGMPAERSMTAVKAAANVSAATGRSIEEVFQRLKDSTKGMTRGVADFAPELANMTQAAAKGGAAIDYLAKKFNGFAQEDLKTAAGQMRFFKNTVDEVMRGVGGAVVAGLDIDLDSGGVLKAAEQIRSSFETLKPVITDVVASLKALALVLSDTLVAAFQASMTPMNVVIAGFKDLKDIANFEFLKKGGPAAFSGLREEVQKTTTVIGEAYKDAAKQVDQAIKVIGNSETATEKQAAAMDKMLADIDKRNTHMKPVKITSEDQLKLLEELTKMVNEVGKRTAMIGATEAQKIHLETIEQQNQIDAMQRRLEIAGVLADNEEAQAQLEAARRSLEIQERMKLHELQNKALEDVNSRILSNNKVLRDFGATQQEIIESQLQAELADIDRLEARSEREGIITDEMRAQLDIARQQAREKAQQGHEAIRRTFDLFKPEDISKLQELLGAPSAGFGASVSNMTSGFLGFAGAASMMVDGFQKLIDFVPQFIEKIAHLFDSVTDLPTKLADAMQHFLDSIVRMASNLIPNLFNMVNRLGDMFVSFVEKLPKAISGMVQRIPSLVTGFIQRLPSLIQRLATAFITYMPQMASGFISAFITGIPQITRALIAAIPAIAKGLAAGIIEGIKESIADIVNAFKGISLKTSFDTSTFKSLGDNVAKQSSKLFAVIDANSANVGNKTADQIASAIDGAVNRAMGILKALWNALRDLWSWVYDKVLGPILTGLQAVWNNLFSWFENKFGPIVGSMWHQLMDWFENRFGPVIAGAWQAILGFFQNTIGPVIGSAWQAILSFFQSAFGPLIGSAWQGAIGFFQNSFGPAIAGAWQGILGFFQNSFGPMIGGAWQGILSFFQTTFGPVIGGAWSGVVTALGGLGATVQKIIDHVVTPLASFKLPAWAWPAFPTFKWPSWPALPRLDASGIGSVISTDLWNGILKFDWTTIGYNIAVGLWNKLISFNWGSLIPGGSSGGGGGVGGVLHSIGLATGGPVYAAGGVFLPRGNDQVPVMAEQGEFVIRRRAVNAVGPGVLNAINQTGQVPQASNVHFDVGGITIQNNGDKVDESFVKNRIMPTLFRELKKASTEGRFIASSRGLRNV